MRHPFALLLMGLLQIVPVLAVSAAVPGGACLDPKWPYRAEWLSGRDILVTATVGARRPRLQVSTTCIGLDAQARISLSASTGCLAMGDSVAVKKLGEPIQSCRVSAVAPAGAETPASH